MPEWPEGEFYDEGFHWYYLSRNRRKEWDEPSATILSNPRHMPLHPLSPPLIKVGQDEWKFSSNGRARRFSYREASLLQGFPKGFKLPSEGTLVQKHKVIGNAVPPALLKAVAQAFPNIW
jgi:DNA (cytosine-5)-methyltransferase 1